MRTCACVDAEFVDEILILQADILRTLAHPRRLEILHRLADRPIEVGRLAEALGLSQPNVSQHLAILKAAGVIGTRREGKQIFCSLAIPQVKQACSLIRDVLKARIAGGHDLSL